MIIFARHGETVSGAEGRFEGFSDSALTEKGKKQAELLGEYLKDKNLSKILVSPRGRAVATAKIVSEILEVDFQIDNRLVEVCYGTWETKKRDTMSNSPLWKKREADFFHFRHPGFYETYAGESYEDLYSRLTPVFIEASTMQQSTLLISHSGVLRCARKYFEKINDGMFKKSKFANSVYFSVEKENEKYRTSLFDVLKMQFIDNQNLSTSSR